MLKRNQYSQVISHSLSQRKVLKRSLPALIVTLFLAILFTLPSLAKAQEDISLGVDQIKHVLSLEILAESAKIKPEELKDKVTIVAFFASWCPPCRDEFKSLNAIKKQLKDKAPTIVAINAFEDFDGNDEARMAKFLQDTAPNFHLVKGTKASLKLFGDVFRIPTLYVFDQEGKLAFDFVHAPNAKKRSVETNELMEAIKPLLVENAS